MTNCNFKWMDGFSLHENGYHYINIPKNASSWMKSLFPECQEITPYWDFPESAITNYIVVLREPISRWVSAAAQVCIGQLDSDRDHAIKHLLEHIIVDDHTTPQTCFINKIPNLDKVIWFDVNENLKELSKEWASKAMDVEPADFDIEAPEENVYNVAKGEQKELKDYFQNLVNTDKDLRKKLEEVYHDDIVLYNSTIFHKLGMSHKDYEQHGTLNHLNCKLAGLR